MPPARRPCSSSALASLSSSFEVQRSRAYRATESLRHAIRSNCNADKWSSAVQALLCLSLGLPLPVPAPAHMDAQMAAPPRGRTAGVIRRGIRAIIRASIAAKAMRELAAVPVANVLVRARARLVQGDARASGSANARGGAGAPARGRA